MKRTRTLVDQFRVEPPSSVRLFRELMRAREEHQALVARRLQALREHDVSTVTALQVANSARALRGARAAWRAAHGGGS